MKNCFREAKMLLPNKEVDLKTWAIIACDQFTSQPEYWHEVEKRIEDKPSTYNLVYPEVYLDEKMQRINTIHDNMDAYLNEGILNQEIQGYIYVKRMTTTGIRHGLIGMIDLEDYDYNPEHKTLIRSTEETVLERIPPRMIIREEASIELPHILLLIDDTEKGLIEPLEEACDQFDLLYDFDLMLEGGHIKGYHVNKEQTSRINAWITDKQKTSHGLFMVAGDGNHSLATAKAYWEFVKSTLPEEKWEDAKERYALVELVNIHDASLQFEPIHRLLLNVDYDNMMKSFRMYLDSLDMYLSKGEDLIFIENGNQHGYSIQKSNGRITVDILQKFLDGYIKRFDARIDYIHGKNDLIELSKKEASCGILLKGMKKEELFPGVVAGGVLPRKTFSMGEATDKRYYIECRKIKGI
ncbi:MAG: DUF1015 domain-containing protein [Holdemanella sp.]|nr:DUF1015 domain-containing protein [Holdemanella sp.]